MKTEIDDLVVINKTELDNWIKYIDTFPLYPEDRKNLMSLKNKPLKPFIEKAFRDGGSIESWSDMGVEMTYENKEDYLKKKINW